MNKWQERIFYLFIISVVVGLGLGYSRVYFFHIIAGITVLTFTLIGIKYPPLETRFHFIFYVMFGWYAVSIFWAPNLYYSAQYLGYILCGVIIVLMMVYYIKSLRFQKKIFDILAWIFVIEIIICLLEVFTSFRWVISPYSPYLRYFGRELDPGIILPQSQISILHSMPTGFHWNPNNLSAVMIIILPFFLFHKNLIIRIIGSISIPTIILFSASRASILGFMVVLLGWSLFFSLKRFFIASMISFPILALIFINFQKFQNSENFFISQAVSTVKIVKGYLFDRNSLVDDINTRELLMKEGLSAFKRTYGLGLGGGGAKATQESSGGIGRRNITSLHNFWLEILIEGGIIFSCIFFLWYFNIIRSLYVIYRENPNFLIKYYSASTAVSFSGYFVAAVGASSAIYILPMYIMFGFAIVTINNSKRMLSLKKQKIFEKPRKYSVYEDRIARRYKVSTSN